MQVFPVLFQSLDSVTIRVEACEKLRDCGPAAGNSFTAAPAGKYGFVNKAIDGITATVNTVEITFHSQAFESKVQVCQSYLRLQFLY